MHFVDRELATRTRLYTHNVVNILLFMRQGKKRNETGIGCLHVISTYRICTMLTEQS